VGGAFDGLVESGEGDERFGACDVYASTFGGREVEGILTIPLCADFEERIDDFTP
jgi:hypothetical protein